MKTIWKFPFSGRPGQMISHSMPKGAKILDVQLQEGIPMLWALVEKDAPQERRSFTLLGTGWDLPPELDGHLVHISTIQDGPFAWHAFEVTS